MFDMTPSELHELDMGITQASDQTMEKFVSSFKHRCLDLRLNQTEVAKRLGMSRPAVTRLLSRKGNPTLKTLSKMSALVGMEICFHVKSNIESPYDRG